MKNQGVFGMNKDLLDRIAVVLPTLSKGQRLIARFILEHYDKAAFMTAARLGQAVGVSESTVVRFAAELELDGYPQLQRSLQDLIRTRLTSVQRIEMTGEQIGNGDLLERVLSMDIEKIRRTIEETSRTEFANAVDALLEARSIYIMGIRSSSSLASFLAFYFNHLFDDVRLITSASTSDVFEQVHKLQKNDIFIGISFPRYSNRTLTAMRFVHDRGAPVIAITDSPQAPIAQLADYKLYARSDMASFVDSLVAPLSLLNALIIAIGIKKRDEVSRVYGELENIWERYHIYTGGDGSDEGEDS
jgi:DNA-binding MurR/RpiR family transcriptional regulator